MPTGIICPAGNTLNFIRLFFDFDYIANIRPMRTLAAANDHRQLALHRRTCDGGHH